MSDTPRTDEVQHNALELEMVARQLERENAELRKALDIVCEDRDYFYGQVEKLQDLHKRIMNTMSDTP